jgi:hypothetical protein
MNVDPEPVIVIAACDTPALALVKARAATNPVAIFLLSFMWYFSCVVVIDLQGNYRKAILMTNR